MPLRRFTGAWWSWTVLVLFTAVNIGLTITVTNSLSQRAIDADRNARASAAEQSRGVVCLVVIKQEAVFRESESQVGQNAADAWHDLGILFRCYDGKTGK